MWSCDVHWPLRSCIKLCYQTWTMKHICNPLYFVTLSCDVFLSKTRQKEWCSSNGALWSRASSQCWHQSVDQWYEQWQDTIRSEVPNRKCNTNTVKTLWKSLIYAAHSHTLTCIHNKSQVVRRIYNYEDTLESYRVRRIQADRRDHRSEFTGLTVSRTWDAWE